MLWAGVRSSIGGGKEKGILLKTLLKTVGDCLGSQGKKEEIGGRTS